MNRLANDAWRRAVLAWSSRASRWKRRGRLRVTMVARVHLTPRFFRLGARRHSLCPPSSAFAFASASASAATSTFAPPPLLSPVASLLDPRRSKVLFAPARERMVHSASGNPHCPPLPHRYPPLQRSPLRPPRFRNASAFNPVPSPPPYPRAPFTPSFTPAILLLVISFSSASLRLVLPLFRPFSLPFLTIHQV